MNVAQSRSKLLVLLICAAPCIDICTGATLAVITIFKNEADILKEWVEHYLSEGVDKFFLIDNNSTDRYRHVLEPYMDRGIVELEVWPLKYGQTMILNSYAPLLRPFSWVLLVDLDEFVYSRLGFHSTKGYLESLHPHVSQIVLPQKYFGSSGRVRQPRGVVKHFTRRASYAEGILCPYFVSGTIPFGPEGQKSPCWSELKGIVRGEHVLKFGLRVHTHIVRHHTNDTFVGGGQGTIDFIHCGITPHLRSSAVGWHGCISEEILKDSVLHLNHYAIQSLTFFKKVKMRRGSVYHQSRDYYRNMQYFKGVDKFGNAMEDSELATKHLLNQVLQSAPDENL